MRRSLALATLAALLLAGAGEAPAETGTPTPPISEAQRSGPFSERERPPLARPQVDCSCRHADGRAQVGEIVCLRRGGRQVAARCEMVLNNTHWRILGEGCEPTS